MRQHIATSVAMLATMILGFLGWKLAYQALFDLPITRQAVCYAVLGLAIYLSIQALVIAVMHDD